MTRRSRSEGESSAQIWREAPRKWATNNSINNNFGDLETNYEREFWVILSLASSLYLQSHKKYYRTTWAHPDILNTVFFASLNNLPATVQTFSLRNCRSRFTFLHGKKRERASLPLEFPNVW